MPRTVRIVLVSLLLGSMAPAMSRAATTYTWNAAGGPWTNPVSWSPARNSPSLDDILIFPAMGGVLISGIPNQTVGQIIFAPGAYYFFQSSSMATLTIIGGTGVDFDLPASAILTFNGSNVLQIGLAGGAT